MEGQGLGKEQLLCDELDRKGIAMCALSEVRWKDKGEYQFGDYLFLKKNHVVKQCSLPSIGADLALTRADLICIRQCDFKQLF